MPRLRLGTRQSPLALLQAERVKACLESQFSDLEVQLCPQLSDGDKDLKTPLSELGGKGVFIKSLEEALLENRIDAAVHSFKDVTSLVPKALALTAFFAPESQCDCLISQHVLPERAIIGTGSIRRQALFKKYRPHDVVHPIRGKVEPRLNQLENGLDAVILSYAGLLRLEISAPYHIEILAPNQFVPAPGQGVICVESRKEDAQTQSYLEAISDPIQTPKSQFELEILSQIGFDCRIPFGFYQDQTHYYAFLSNADLTTFWTPTWPLAKKDQITAEIVAKAKALGW